MGFNVIQFFEFQLFPYEENFLNQSLFVDLIFSFDLLLLPGRRTIKIIEWNTLTEFLV